MEDHNPSTATDDWNVDAYDVGVRHLVPRLVGHSTHRWACTMHRDTDSQVGKTADSLTFPVREILGIHGQSPRGLQETLHAPCTAQIGSQTAMNTRTPGSQRAKLRPLPTSPYPHTSHTKNAYDVIVERMTATLPVDEPGLLHATFALMVKKSVAC